MLAFLILPFKKGEVKLLIMDFFPFFFSLSTDTRQVFYLPVRG